MEVIERPQIMSDKDPGICVRGACPRPAEWLPRVDFYATPPATTYVNSVLAVGFCGPCRAEVSLGELIEPAQYQILNKKMAHQGLDQLDPLRTVLTWLPYKREVVEHARQVMGDAPNGSDVRMEGMSFGGQMNMLLRAVRGGLAVNMRLSGPDKKPLVPDLPCSSVDLRSLAIKLLEFADWADGSLPRAIVMPPIPPGTPMAELERVRTIVHGLVGLEAAEATKDLVELLEQEDQLDWDGPEVQERYQLALDRAWRASLVMGNATAENIKPVTPEQLVKLTWAAGAFYQHRIAEIPVGEDAMAEWAEKDTRYLAALRAALWAHP